MKLLKHKTSWWLALAIAIGLAGWGGHHVYQTRQFNEAQAMSEEMFKPEMPQPLCFGRMVIDLPKGAQMQGSLYQYPGAHNVQEKARVTQAEFDQTVSEFEAHLRNTKHEKDPSLLKSLHPVPGKDGAKVFVHWEKDYSIHLMNLTGYALVSGTQYTFASEVSFEFIEKATNEMVTALANLRPRAPNEVPPEHGFCLNTAFIPDTLTGEWLERAKVAFDVKPWQDVGFSIRSATQHVKEPTSLVERMTAMIKRTPGAYQGVTVIRSGQRNAGPLVGEEMLTRITENGQTFYLFVWEAEGALHRNDPPSVHMELRVGQESGKPELTQTQALALWEYLLAHLRLRPTTTPTKTSEAAPPKAPLGELVATGRDCPQTGWWQCADAGEVQGGRRQYFRAGERMPHAVLLGEPSVWQKLKGERPSHKTATVWQLVDYGEPPAAPTLPAEAPPSADSTPSANEEA